MMSRLPKFPSVQLSPRALAAVVAVLGMGFVAAVLIPGFELASGRPAVTETSDLDIVIRAPEPFDRAFANSICVQLEGVSTRVDVLVETPYCGFSLDEYAHSQLHKVLVRTDTGRILAADPWDVPNRRQSWM